MRFNVLLLCFLLYSFNIYSQEYVIKGCVVDSLTQKRIPYAHIFYEKGKGSVSNAKGEFIMHFNDASKKKTYLSVSCIGYFCKKIAPEKINTNNVNYIYLKPKTYSLKGVEIKTKKVSAYDILQKALDSFRLNDLNRKIFYRCNYLEFHELYTSNQRNNDTTHRIVKSEFLLETKPAKNFFRNWNNTINERIFFINIDKGKSKLAYEDRVKQPNELKYLITENALNYRFKIFYLKNKFNYKIKNIYFDSALNKKIIEISIVPKDTLNEFEYVNVFITSEGYKIIKVHKMYFYSKDKASIDKKFGEYRYLDEEALIEYKIDSNNRLILSYIQRYYGNSFNDIETGKITLLHKIFSKINVVEVVPNGPELKNGLNEMDYNKNIYQQ